MNPFTDSTVARPAAHTEYTPCGKPLALTRLPQRRRKRTPLVASLAPTIASLLRAGVLAGIFLPALAHGIDVNSATPEQLRGVKGIGPKTAEMIIEERGRGGRYESMEDLSDRVKGIGPKKASALKAAGLIVGKPAAATAASIPQVRQKPR